MKKVLKYLFVWRLWLFIPFIIAVLFLPVRSNSEFTVWHSGLSGDVLKDTYLYPWANFDGVHYLGIASRGYIDEGRFLPLFPALVKVEAIFLEFINITTEPIWAGILVSTFATFFAFFFLQKLLALDFDTKKINQSFLLFLLFPTAFFFGVVYSEGLFLLLAVLILYFSRKKKWFVTSLLVMLISVTRLSGLLLLFPVLFEYFNVEIRSLKKVKFSYNFFTKNKQLLLFLMSPILLLGYAYFNLLTWGDPLYFVNAHGALGNSRETTALVFPLITVYRYLKIFFTVSPQQYEYWIAVLEFASLGFVSYGIYLIWKLKLRMSYFIYSISMVVLPLLSGTLTGFPRYILPVFPIFVALSLQLEKKKKLRIIFLIFSTLLQAILFGLFVQRYFVA